jgi:membrane peptidoglycan carboxypeptidase
MKSRATYVFQMFLMLLVLTIVGGWWFVRQDLATMRDLLARSDRQNVPPLAVAAFVAAEDPDFFQHSRFFTVGHLFHVGSHALSNRDVGAQEAHASLTDQLIMRGVSQGRGLSRIAREILTAAVLDIAQPKESIANAYVQNVYLGRVSGENIYGLAEGARKYFSVDQEQLSPAQLATLAASVRSPTLLSPYANSERAVARRLLVLDRMHDAGTITDPEYKLARTAIHTQSN